MMPLGSACVNSICWFLLMSLVGQTSRTDKGSMSGHTKDPRQMSVRPKDPQPKRRRRRKPKETLSVDITQNITNTANYGPHTAKVATTVARFGYSQEEVQMAVHKLKQADSDITYDSLIDMSSVVQQQTLERDVVKSFSGRELEQPVKAERLKFGEESNPEDADNDEDEEEGEEEGRGDNYKCEEWRLKLKDQEKDLKIKAAITKRKNELRAAIDAMTFTCHVCRCSKATILMLPCGHLASCDDCLMDIRRCPVARCNKIVRGTKEVFFV